VITGNRRPVWLSQAAQFALVGVSNTLLDFGLFSLLVHLRVPVVVSNCISYSAGVAWSFFWNQRWTFGNAAGFRLTVAGRFLLVNLLSVAVSTALLYGLTAFWPPATAKLATLPIMFAWSFTLSKFYVFTP
jgi:putative flippase GtrA